MKLLNKLFLSMALMLVLVGCIPNSELPKGDKPSSYDGSYYSQDSIIKKNNKEIFTIKNGRLNSEPITAELNEGKMDLTSKNSNYNFTYNEGEFVILDKNKKKVLYGYKKNSRSYNYIDRIYGEYSRDIEPRVKQIIKESIDTTVDGDYFNTNYESRVSKVNIQNGNLKIYYKEKDEEKISNYELTLSDVTIDEPLWDRDRVESIDKKMLEYYSSWRTINDLKENSGFNIKFMIDNSNTEYITLKFPQASTDENGVNIVSKVFLGEDIIDDIFEKEMH